MAGLYLTYSPRRNKLLLKAYQPLVALNKALSNSYFEGGKFGVVEKVIGFQIFSGH